MKNKIILLAFVVTMLAGCTYDDCEFIGFGVDECIGVVSPVATPAPNVEPVKICTPNFSTVDGVFEFDWNCQ